MRSEEIIRRLFELGHFNRPGSRSGVKASDLSKLTLTDTDVRNAIISYQDFMRGRSTTDDAEDPEFVQLIEQPRCGFPDFPVDSEGVRLYASDQPLEANWPTSCRGKLKYGRVFKALKGLNQQQVDEMLIAAMNCWNYSVDVLITPNPNWEKSGAHIWCDAEPLSGSTLAWSYLADNSCNRPKQQRIHSGRTWQFWYAVTTMAHELGHVLGHPHIQAAGALMRPEINDQSLQRKGWQGGPDFAQSEQLGYRIKNRQRPSDEVMIRVPGSVNPPDPPTPPPPNPTNPFANFRIVDKQTGKEFLIVPSPEF